MREKEIYVAAERELREYFRGQFSKNKSLFKSGRKGGRARRKKGY